MDHERILVDSITAFVYAIESKVPYLKGHSARVALYATEIDAETGSLMGAISEEQVRRVGELVTGAGQPFELLDVPDAAHSMHRHDPELFATTVRRWSSGLGPTD